tara:strand:+ start:8211 stop:9875 length:1665 start_codon:yes stop_codon:yes gene_type:complete
MVELTHTDIQKCDKIYHGLNQTYNRYSLQHLKDILYIESDKGKLLPFLKFKHANIDYHNLNNHTQSIINSATLKNLPGINAINDVQTFKKKYGMLISDSVVVVEQLLPIIKLNGYIITISCHDVSLPGLDKIYNIPESGATLYKKSYSYYRIKRFNEFKGHVQAVDDDISYEVIEPKNVDMSIALSKVDEEHIRINVIRFDSVDIIEQPIKLKVFKDTSNSAFITINMNNESINVSEHKLNFKLTVPKISEKSKIPKVICQTLNDDIIGEIHHRTVINLKLLNPEYDYVFFDAPARRNFISQHYDKAVLDAYDGLVSGAFKADIFRYCWLYACGGVYIDCKMINRTALRKFITEDHQLFLCRDRIPNAYQNCFIAAAPRRDDILKCIHECVVRFQLKINKRVSFGSLYHTGPYLFYECMKDTPPECAFEGPFNSQNYLEHTIKSISTNTVLFNLWYKDYYASYKSLHQRPIWSEQWAKNEIYYSDKFKINNLKQFTILVCPNQTKNIDDLSNLTFDYDNDTIWNSKFKLIKCQLIDEINHTEQLIYVKKKNSSH